jgi:hypothetical protein
MPMAILTLFEVLKAWKQVACVIWYQLAVTDVTLSASHTSHVHYVRDRVVILKYPNGNLYILSYFTVS